MATRGSASAAIVLALIIAAVMFGGPKLSGNSLSGLGSISGAQAVLTGFATKSECTGTPTAACDSLTEQSACTVVGCSWTERCSGGQVADCNSLAQNQCSSQKNCALLGQSCIGIALPCGSIRNQQDCAAQQLVAGGTCAWGSACSGTPSACSTFTGQDTCTAQTGCSWSQTCTDADSDGYGVGAVQSGCDYEEDDCDDADADVNPGKTEVPNNSKDDDCNPATLDKDVTPPVISNLAASSVEKTSVDIVWRTDEDATGALDYSTSASSLNLQKSNLTSLLIQHLFKLSGLAKNTTYYFKATSCDAAGNCNSSGISNFMTLPPTPCSGSIGLSVPEKLTRNTQATAVVAGLTDGCKGRLAILKTESCNGLEAGSAAITNDGNASISFTAPNTPGAYTYAACIDLSGDGKFTAQGEAGTSDVEVVACIRAQPEISVEPDTQDVGIGQIGEYKITVTNKNTCASTFELNSTCLPGGQESWLCTFTPQIVSVAVRAKGASTLEINTPEKAAAGFDAIFDVVAKDTAAPEYRASARVHNIVTICTAAKPEMHILPKSRTELAGTDTNYSVSVKNSGNCAAEYSLSVSCPDGWACSLDEKTLDVRANSEGSTTLNAKSPEDATSASIKVAVKDKKDESLAAEATASYKIQTCTDVDGDSYFAEGMACSEKDCDDADAEINPGVVTEQLNGKDDNCDGKLDTMEEDADNDGFPTYQGDCDDLNANVNPKAAEVCTDKIDNNCNAEDDNACAEPQQNIIKSTLGAGEEESEDTTLTESIFDGEKPVAGEEVRAEVKAGKKGFSIYFSIPIIVILAAIGLVYQFYIRPKQQLSDMSELHDIGPGTTPEDAQNFVSGGLAEGLPLGQIKDTLAERGMPEAKIDKAMKFAADDMGELDDLAKKRRLDKTKEYDAGEKYVSDCIDKGYSPVQIKAALVDAGWPDYLVEKLIGTEVSGSLEKLARQFKVNKPSGDADALQNFVKEAVKSGHTQESIKKVLVDYGWDEVRIGL